MKKINESTFLEFENSNFIIDLITLNNGEKYVEINQTINGEVENRQTLKLNSNVLSNIIKVLQNYHSKIPNNSERNLHLSDLDQQNIQDYYLKGVTIKDISIQFEQSVELIEMILKNRGIEIVSNELPKQKFWINRKSKFKRR